MKPLCSHFPNFGRVAAAGPRTEPALASRRRETGKVIDGRVRAESHRHRDQPAPRANLLNTFLHG
jgi:hypothetical protein